MLSGKMTVLINPEIITHSRETATEEEGCLSLPGVVIPVARFLSVTIRYLDEEGKEQERRLMGMDARVAQHEIDHLEGRLIVDDLKLPIATDRSTLGSRHATVI
jgi:peptide deformylase